MTLDKNLQTFVISIAALKIPLAGMITYTLETTVITGDEPV